MNESRRPPTDEGFSEREAKQRQLIALLHGFNEMDVFQFLKTNPNLEEVQASPDVEHVARSFLLQMFERYITIESIETFLQYFPGIRDSLSSPEIRAIAAERFQDEYLRYADWNPAEYQALVDTWIRLFPEFAEMRSDTTKGA